MNVTVRRVEGILDRLLHTDADAPTGQDVTAEKEQSSQQSTVDLWLAIGHAVAELNDPGREPERRLYTHIGASVTASVLDSESFCMSIFGTSRIRHIPYHRG